MKQKTENWSGGRLKEISEEISRVFNGQPVVDAKHDLHVVILLEDIKNAKPKHFEDCVFALACKRSFNSEKVLLMRSIAYISLPDAKGNYKVQRFYISDQGKKLIADFDRGKLPKPGAGFVFKAPTKSQTLDKFREAQAKFHRKKREAKLLGTITNVTKKSKQIKTPSQSILDIRNGTGLIQMRIKENS